MLNWQAVRQKQLSHLIVDLSMLSLALVHLGLLLFDTTYFYLRPLYLQALPQVVLAYDPLKGVEPHRFSQDYLQQAERYFQSCQSEPALSAAQIQSLTQLSREMIEEDPFARAQLSGKLEIIKAHMRKFTGVNHSSKAAFDSFWQAGCAQLTQRQAFFETEIAPYLRMNFWRRLNTRGNFVDYFLYLDLCFILIFLTEFLISWAIAVRELGKEQRVLYPIYHWYDWVSCIPLQSLRALRLLRVLTVFYRLIQTELVDIRHFRLYQIYLKYQGIVLEELSDRVAINILSNIQAKTRLGANRDLLEETLSRHRQKIRELLLDRLQALELPSLQAHRQELVEILAHMLMHSIRATQEYQRLAHLPLMGSVLEQVLNEERVGRLSEEALQGFFEAGQRYLQTETVQLLLRELVDDLLDQLIEASLYAPFQQLLEDINLQVLEDLKDSSTTKIWKAEEQKLIAAPPPESQTGRPPANELY